MDSVQLNDRLRLAEQQVKHLRHMEQAIKKRDRLRSMLNDDLTKHRVQILDGTRKVITELAHPELLREYAQSAIELLDVYINRLSIELQHEEPTEESSAN